MCFIQVNVFNDLHVIKGGSGFVGIAGIRRMIL